MTFPAMSTTPMLVLALLFAAPAQALTPRAFAARLAALEARHGGRLGVAALDTGTHKRLTHRATERFALCSTFKVALVAAVLARVDGGQETLERPVAYGPSDLLEYAPVTRLHVGEGSMSIAALCAATLEQSDNTAANLLLNTLGGPGRVTEYLRTQGDTVTRLDRNEPSLNSNLPGDPRDTTTPEAMLETLQRILAGPALSPASRQRLEGHLIACTTGAKRLRAGLPPTWRVGDKTGSGSRGATNDIAILWPPGRPPIFVVAYYTDATAPAQEREAVLAEVGQLVATTFSK